jgi:hypothetical protein
VEDVHTDEARVQIPVVKGVLMDFTDELIEGR